MDAKIKAKIENQDTDKDLIRLKERLKRNLKRSRDSMGRHFDNWDRNLAIYNSERPPDRDDEKASEKDEPEKMIVPISYSQVSSFVTFCVMLFTQNNRFFTLDPSGNEDYRIREAAELFLERDLRNSKWLNKLIQFILDVARFNLGVGKLQWEEDTIEVEASGSIDMESSADGVMVERLTERLGPKRVTLKAGNVIESVSPYNFLPDPNVSIANWRDGQFAGDESTHHIDDLWDWEDQGLVIGVDKISPFTERAFSDRGKTRLEAFGGDDAFKNGGKDDDDFMVCVTNVQHWLSPKKYGLGESSQRELYNIVIANDDTIIGISPMDAAHRKFSYFVGQMSSDMHTELCNSLSDKIHPLQEVISWLLNSRITSVRTSLDRHLVIQPQFVNMDTVESRSPFITLKKNAPMLGADKFIQQLRTTDTTQSHIADAEALMKITSLVTGVNDNMQGSYSSGRRSATEAKAVTSGGASRIKLIAASIYEMAITDLGTMMLLNLRQNVELDEFTKFLGQGSEELYDQFAPEDVTALMGSQDFFVYDGTSENEKGYTAQALQELFMSIAQSPEMLSVLPLDLAAMLKEIYTLRGVKNLTRFIPQTNEGTTRNPGPTPTPAPISDAAGAV